MAPPLIVYLDTNAVIWLAAGKTGSISPRAAKLLETSDLLISAVVLLELEMLHEGGRLVQGANEILAHMAQRIGLGVCQLPMSAIVDQAISVKWTREPGDRLIVANAMARNHAPLITSDRRIREHYPNAIWQDVKDAATFRDQEVQGAVRVQNHGPVFRVQRFRSILRRIAPFWICGVVIGSFLPGSWKLELGTHPYTLSHAVSWQHRALHFVTFGVTKLLFLALAERPRGWAKGIAGAVLLGLAIEAGQYTVRLSRVLEWWDIRDDVLAVAGAAVVFGIGRWLSQRRAKP